MTAGLAVTSGRAHRGGLRAARGRPGPRSCRLAGSAGARRRIAPARPCSGRAAAGDRHGPGHCLLQRPQAGPHAGGGGRPPGPSSPAALACRGVLPRSRAGGRRPADGRPAVIRAQRGSGDDPGSGGRTRPQLQARSMPRWTWPFRLHRRDRPLLPPGAGQKMTYSLRIVSWICHVPAQPRGKTAVLPGPISCGGPPSGVTVIRPDTTYTNSLVSSFQ